MKLHSEGILLMFLTIELNIRSETLRALMNIIQLQNWQAEKKKRNFSTFLQLQQ